VKVTLQAAVAVAAAFFGTVLPHQPALAQEAVVGVDDAEALFTSPDPRLNANKQVVYHVVRDLLEAGHWELADRYLTDRYIQHNPNAPSGRQGVVDLFTKRLGVVPRPIPLRTTRKIVAVLAEGDLVMVAFPSEQPDPAEPGKTYWTTWFDMFRLKDGKVDEHWDNSPKFGPPPPSRP
jgi:predicted SnoaL-like aldol condensation-catalyzing enzyme